MQLKWLYFEEIFKLELIRLIKNRRKLLMNIVILDRMALGEDIDMSVFEKLGTVTIYERTAPEEVVERLKDADALLTNKVVIGKMRWTGFLSLNI